MKEFKGLLSTLAQKLKSDKKLLCIMLIGIAGMIIIMATELGGKPNAGETDTKKSSSSPPSSTQSVNEYTYAQEVEKKLSNLVGSIEGAGKSKVMVTLENGVEQVYATQDKTKNSTSSSGGSGNINENIERENEYILLKSNEGGETGLIIKIIQPNIRGVAIVCEGADSIRVKQSITETVTAVLGISSAKVNIAKMADNQQTEE